MKKSYQYTCLLGLSFVMIAFLTSSCKKFLDVNPKDEVPEDQLFESYAGNQAALTSCYLGLRSQTLYGENLMFTLIETIANQWNEPSSVNQKVQLLFYRHDYEDNASRQKIKSIYDAFFNVIVQANTIIKHNGKGITNPKDRSIILGEAHAIRGLCYLDLLRLFGPVPSDPKGFKLTFSNVVSYKVNEEELTFDEYVKRLEEELKTAEALLVDTDPCRTYSLDALNNVGNAGYPSINVSDPFMMNRQMRLNYWAVKALQARLALYLGNRPKAHALAMEIINAKGADGKSIITLSTLDDVDKKYYSSPSEALFLLSIKDLSSQTINILGGSTSTHINPTTMYWQREEVIKNKIFDNENLTEDVRYKNIWEFESSSASSTKYPTTRKFFYSIENRDPNKIAKLKLKYSVLPIIRLSEIYLIAMESSDDLAEVNRLYSTYMRSKNVIVGDDHFSSLSDVTKLMPKEYLKEFIAEGIMFYVYKRRHMDQFLLTDRAISDKAYVFPNPDKKNDDQLPNESDK